MRTTLQTGDKVKLLPANQLLEVFENRNFFSEDFRKETAEKLGGKEGTVESIEDKYAFDYFFFSLNGENDNWSIPYQAVDFSHNPTAALKKEVEELKAQAKEYEERLTRRMDMIDTLEKQMHSKDEAVRLVNKAIQDQQSEIARLREALEAAVKQEQDKYDQDLAYADRHNNTDGVGISFDYYSAKPMPKWVDNAKAALKSLTLQNQAG